ncbi:phage protein [Bartonella krasnovii]|uniref:Phage protein n=1 Tax=Bartonella krasnovii TaxID=2267275 RepID=A0A5B9D3E2_9HYPH|nr:phage protein [Bartonella krasnovii]
MKRDLKEIQACAIEKCKAGERRSRLGRGAVFSLLAKVLPLQVTEEGNVKTISRIEIVPVKSKEPQSEKCDLEA